MTLVAEHSLLRGRMISPYGPGLAVAIASAVVLSGCGGSGRAGHDGAGAGTSLAAAVVAFVAPRDGADAAIGGQLANFAQKVQTKLLGNCMTDDGFSAPAFGGGPSNDLGNPQFPNLPAIEASHNLGLFVGGGVPFFDPQSGMSEPERRAWQARLLHCFRSTQGKTPLFGSAKFAQLNSGWFNIVNQVSQSAQIRALSKKAARCSAAHGVPATSVMSLYGRLQGEIGPISQSAQNSDKVQAIQAKGASVLTACWASVINKTTDLLGGRRSAFLTQNANVLSALETQVNSQVSSLERQYGIKLAVGGS